MSPRQTHDTTDYRLAWWFSLGWTVVIAVTLWYVALRSAQSIAEVLEAERANGVAFLLAGWLSAWGAPFLFGGSVRITVDRIYVRRLRDRLLGRTLEIRLHDIVEIEEVRPATSRSQVLRITTTDGRRVHIQHYMLRESEGLRTALLELRPAEASLAGTAAP